MRCIPSNFCLVALNTWTGKKLLDNVRVLKRHLKLEIMKSLSWMPVVVLLILPLWPCSAEVDLHDNEQKQRNFNQIAPLSKLNGIRAFDMPDLVGFSYSRASIGGPKTRFIKFEEKVIILSVYKKPT